jgi:hypothetical protein
MNSPVNLPGSTEPATAELLSLIPGISVLPDEDPLLLEDMRSAFLREFVPGTPYERALVEDLVSLEWEMLRERRLRDLSIITKFRAVAIGTFTERKLSDFTSFAGPEDRADGHALMGSDPEARAGAEARLSEIGLTRGELVADTYRRLGKQMELHNRTLADLERRRDRLREQFDRLKASRIAAQAAAGEVEDIAVEGN